MQRAPRPQHSKVEGSRSSGPGRRCAAAPNLPGSLTRVGSLKTPQTFRGTRPAPGLPAPPAPPPGARRTLSRPAAPGTCTGVMYGKPSSRRAPSTRGCSRIGSDSQEPSVTCSMARPSAGAAAAATWTPPGHRGPALPLPASHGTASNRVPAAEFRRAGRVLAAGAGRTGPPAVKAGGWDQAGVVRSVPRSHLGSGAFPPRAGISAEGFCSSSLDF